MAAPARRPAARTTIHKGFSPAPGTVHVVNRPPPPPPVHKGVIPPPGVLQVVNRPPADLPPVPPLPAPVAVVFPPGGGAEIPVLSPPAPPPATSPDTQYTAQQITNLVEAITVGEDMGAPDLALLAMVLLGLGEPVPPLSNDTCNSTVPPHCGFFQLSAGLQAEHDWKDVLYWSRRAYADGFYGRGGLIANAKDNPTKTAGWVVNQCQGADTNSDRQAIVYNRNLGEARRLLAKYRHGPAAAGGGVYANMMADAEVTPERVDQGVDYAGTGYFAAIAAGRVTHVVPNGWGRYGNFFEYVITQPGPLDGVHIAHAEGIEALLKVGDTFTAGRRLVRLIPGWPYGTETLFTTGAADLRSWHVHNGGSWTSAEDKASSATRAGIAMSDLIAQLGGPRGLIQGPPIGPWPPWANNGVLDPGVQAGAGGQSYQAGGPGLPSSSAEANALNWGLAEKDAWVALYLRALEGSHHSHAAMAFATGIKSLTSEVF